MISFIILLAGMLSLALGLISMIASTAVKGSSETSCLKFADISLAFCALCVVVFIIIQMVDFLKGR